MNEISTSIKSLMYIFLFWIYFILTYSAQNKGNIKLESLLYSHENPDKSWSLRLLCILATEWKGVPVNWNSNNNKLKKKQ